MIPRGASSLGLVHCPATGQEDQPWDWVELFKDPGDSSMGNGETGKEQSRS